MAYTQEQLEEAVAARSLRLLGLQPTSVKYDGREVTYSLVTLAALDKHINEMRAALSGSPRPRFSALPADRGFRR